VLLFAHVDGARRAWLRSRRGRRVRPSASPVRLACEETVRSSRSAVLAAMKMPVYLAIARLPLSTVGAIESSARSRIAATRRTAATSRGAACDGRRLRAHRSQFGGEPFGFVFAFANAAGSCLRHARTTASPQRSGLDRLGAMLLAAVVVTPIGLAARCPPSPTHLLLWGVGVGSAVGAAYVRNSGDGQAGARHVALMLALLR